MAPAQVAWLSQHTEWWRDGGDGSGGSNDDDGNGEGGALPIQTLDLSNRQLTYTSLQLLPETLTCLDLSRCGLEQAAGLQRLPRLELLNVSYNRLTSIDSVRSSRALKVLYARSNRINSVEGLGTIRSLQSLDLECNALGSLDALAPLWGLPKLVELRLRGNLLPAAVYRRACQVRLPLPAARQCNRPLTA